MSDRSVVRLLVVPPRMSDYRGEEALLAAATPHGEHSASSILETVVEAEEVDPFDQLARRGWVLVGPRPGCAVVQDAGSAAPREPEPVTGVEPATSSLQERRSTN